ncbi:hypothetical protein F3N42_13275 [Marinihelvus fidelis]|uniref:Uncharacterized protein n=2 Tax=Marinihelvus fidelis TaxID=2613842 RepID=A0A5N0T740_9GAMM|nr:hypothetical protein F3N42_13275 [Marinihelvus fidelis]
MMKHMSTACIAALLLTVVASAPQADPGQPPHLSELDASEWTEVEQAFELAYEQWDAGFTAELATSGDPSLRVMGLYMLAIVEHAGGVPLGTLPHGRDIRALAETPGMTNDATWVAAKICGESCLSERMIDILADAEPGNGAVIVLDLQRHRAQDPINWLNNPGVRERLLSLSSSDRFDAHPLAQLAKLQTALEKYLHANPFPPMPKGVGDMSGAAAWLELLTHSVLSMSFPTWVLVEACRVGVDTEDDAVVNACRHAAGLMIAGSTEPERHTGRHIERILDHPEPDSETRERWQRELMGRTWAKGCLSSFQSNEKALLAAITPKDAYQWARDGLQLGSLEASFNLATTLHDRYLGALTVDPSECRRFERLTHGQIDRIFHDGEQSYSVRWEQAFIRMEALENAGELETLGDR